MNKNMSKVDLHVHSRFSKRPSQWVLQKLGCPESFSEPRRVYEAAKKRGMTMVTITDHNTIAGCLEIADLPGVFISEEVTAYFPDDGCKVHVLVHNITEVQHRDIQKVRENLFDLVGYLNHERIHHTLAHPLFPVNDRLSMEHIEVLLLLFKNFEVNGARGIRQNDALRMVLSGLKPAFMEMMVEKHGYEPPFSKPWIKNLTGGSDDHSSLTIAYTYTQVENADSPEAFLRGICEGAASVVERASTPLTLAHHIYGIAYQFYRSKFSLERYAGKDILIRFLDGFLNARGGDDDGFMSRIHFFWNRRRRPRAGGEPAGNIQDLLRNETRLLLWADPELMKIAGRRKLELEDMETKWFDFVNQVSNKVLLQFSNHLMDHLSGANIFNIFQSVGAAGGLYALLAPYFVSFSIFSSDRRFRDEVLRWFLPKERGGEDRKPVKMAHFTDTYYEVNGVATTLHQQIKVALESGKNLTLITCDGENRHVAEGVENFKPVGVYELPEYPEQKLNYPPFLEMLRYCYERDFTHIHSATPGPIGLAALAIGRILRLPIYGTYHTALPQYAQVLTNDSAVEDFMWKYTLWYYEQMDLIFVPSQSTGDELVQKGIPPYKIRLFPRGIDIARFHPSKRSADLSLRRQLGDGIRLLYVGRISKEKNLHLLERAFRTLVRSVTVDVRLIIVGDGPYLKEMRESMKGLPCTFTGYMEGEELAAMYATCDIFVFPSTTDTFGNVVLEAQASGLPVVVSDAGGPQENMIHEVTGFITRADDMESLLQAVTTLLSNSQLRERMGRAARLYAEERSFEKAYDETWQMYDEGSGLSESPLAKVV